MACDGIRLVATGGGAPAGGLGSGLGWGGGALDVAEIPLMLGFFGSDAPLYMVRRLGSPGRGSSDMGMGGDGCCQCRWNFRRGKRARDKTPAAGAASGSDQKKPI